MVVRNVKLTILRTVASEVPHLSTLNNSMVPTETREITV
jgi:hypothetical protein